MQFRNGSGLSGAVVYLLALVVGVVPLYVVMALDPDAAEGWIPVLMWIPALAGVAARLITGRRFVLGRPSVRTLLLSAVPILLVLALYAGASAVGLLDWLGLESFPGIGTVLMGLGSALVVVIGEELGWRGYLLPQLRTRYGFLAANAMVVAIWFAYHVPVILIPGVYGNEGLPLWANLLFFLLVVSGFGFFVGWLWELHHDVWSATSAHTLWNSLIQSVYTVMFVSASAWWMGEFGVLAGVAMLALLVVALRGGRRYEQALGDDLTRPRDRKSPRPSPA